MPAIDTRIFLEKDGCFVFLPFEGFGDPEAALGGQRAEMVRVDHLADFWGEIEEAKGGGLRLGLVGHVGPE